MVGACAKKKDGEGEDRCNRLGCGVWGSVLGRQAVRPCLARSASQMELASERASGGVLALS